MITAQYLLEGAFYAFEQCGILLRDAVTLYKNDAYSSAIVLTAFAREELGRSRILFELRKEVVENGKCLILKDINDMCEGHVKKQEMAQLSMVQRASGDERLAELLRKLMRNHPQSKEYKETIKQLNDITKKQKKRTPNERHKKRMKALYVEPNDSGTGWNRPLEESKIEAKLFLNDAVNDYAVQYDRLQHGYIQDVDTELFHALQGWTKRPGLPLPQWP